MINISLIIMFGSGPLVYPTLGQTSATGCTFYLLIYMLWGPTVRTKGVEFVCELPPNASAQDKSLRLKPNLVAMRAPLE